ncbi:MAG: glycosyltransferase [Acidobacteriota bacterium]
MKVLFYNHTGQVSGAERVMLMILSGIDRNKFQASVICPKLGDLTGLAEDIGVPVINVELLEARFTWRPDRLIQYLASFFEVIMKLRRVIMQAEPDLIHANTIRAGLVATTATLGTRIQVIWHLHDMLPRHPLSTLIRWYATISPRTNLLAISWAVAHRFRGGALRLINGCRKIQVIHNGIDLKRFIADPGARQKVRDEFKLAEGTFVIGIVGQITPRKGQLELIRAFARIVHQIPRSRLVVVGAPLFNNDHEYLLKIKQAAEDLKISDRVIFTGARSDVPVIMCALDLLVLNSKIEPLGLVVLEAMVCGTPVLATAVDGVPELMNHKVTGWLVSAGNEKQLAESIITLGNNWRLRNGLAENARRNVVSGFSKEKYLWLVENYYKQVCRPSRALVDGGLAVER